LTISPGSTGFPQYPHFVELHIWIPLLRQQVAQAAKNHLEEVQLYSLLPSRFACVINHIDLLLMPVFSPLQARWYAVSSHTASKDLTMNGKVVPCPICQNEAIVSKHQTLSPTLKTSVPCYIYTCEKDGWFKLSESVHSLLIDNPAPRVINRLTKIVTDNYFPASLIPAEAVTPLRLIENLE